MRRLTAVALAVAVLGSACGADLSSEVSVIDTPFPAITDPVVAEEGAVDPTEPAPEALAPSTDPETSDTTTVDPQPTDTTDTDAAAPLSPKPQLVATAAGDLVVYDAFDGAPSTTLAAQTVFGSTTTLLVLERTNGWLRVVLPIEPNGQTGWIPESDVSLTRVDVRVEVSLADRTLTVFDEDTVVLSTTVAIGTEANPTPIGTNLFVTDVLDTGDTESPYGPFALGLSLFSETLSEFGGGDGQIGIHGTDDPSSIGQAASHGCVRVPNDVVTQLAGLLPLGTPVTIG